MRKRKKTRRPNSCCIDCGCNTNVMPKVEPEGHTENYSEYYMVHDQVWNAAGLPPLGGCLCIGCLERRLGRKLTRHDFTDASVNDPSDLSHTDRLRDRLLH